MRLTVGSFDLKKPRSGAFWKELSKALSLSLVLFALTFRTALPLGVSIVTDENGIPLVICQQIAQAQEQLRGDEDTKSSPTTPAYQCPFCMVLNADKAPLLFGTAPDVAQKSVAMATVEFLEYEVGYSTKRLGKNNLGRDPPLV